MVAPFMLPEDIPLSGVSGVFNAVETISEPLGNVMFYGPGAGAGPTASAMVGDLMQVMCSGRRCANPVFVKDGGDVAAAFDSFVCKNYFAFPAGCEASIVEFFGHVQFIESESEVLFITPPASEADMSAKLAALKIKGIDPISRIRII